MIQARQFSSVEDMQAHYRAVRSRLNGGKPAPKPLKIEIPAEAAELVARFTEIEIKPRQHLPAPESSVVKARKAVAEIAKAHGFTPEEIYGPRVHAPLVRARFSAYAAVYRMNPHWSGCRTARFFNRDHTTYLRALRKMGLKA